MNTFVKLEDYLCAVPESIDLVCERQDDWVAITVNDDYLNPDESLKIWNHSPSGFEWGYGGSGPAQLSLALLMLFLPVKLAVQYHQPFKFDVISGLNRDGFNGKIPLRQILETLSKTVSQS